MLAGIWEIAEYKGDSRVAFAILTDEPNELVASYHDRMPLALADDKVEAWLDLSNESPLDEKLLLDLNEFTVRPMDRAMNNVRQKNLAAIDPEARRPEQASKLVRRRLDEVDERSQRRRHETPSGVVEKRPAKRCHQGSRTGSSAPLSKYGRSQSSKNATMPVPAIAASTARSVAAADAHEQRPGRLDLHDLAVALELPGGIAPLGNRPRRQRCLSRSRGCFGRPWRSR